jgi:hypothetical protein
MRRFLRALWQRWKLVAERLAHAQARLVFSLLYFVVVTPFALALKWLSDPLQLRPREGSRWHPVTRQTSNLEDARRQF